MRFSFDRGRYLIALRSQCPVCLSTCYGGCMMPLVFQPLFSVVAADRASPGYCGNNLFCGGHHAEPSHTAGLFETCCNERCGIRGWTLRCIREAAGGIGAG